MKEKTMKISRNDNKIIVKLPPMVRGISNVKDIEELEKLINEEKCDIILDFAETKIIDSSAIGKFIFISKELKTHNNKIFIQHCPEDIRDLFRKLRIDTVFEML